MKPFSLFGKKIPAWVPAGILAIGIIGAVVYAASKTDKDNWWPIWLKSQPLGVRLALNDESLLCSNEYYSTRYSSFKYDDENTIDMILAEITEVSTELATREEELANYLSLDTSDWTEEMLEDRPETIKAIEEEIEDLNKKLEQLEEKLKQLEDEVHIESYTPPAARRRIDTSRFINNALSVEEGYSRDTLIAFDTESWLKYQAAVQWEFLSNTAKEEYFKRHAYNRPAYQALSFLPGTGGSTFTLVGHADPYQPSARFDRDRAEIVRGSSLVPYFDASSAEKVSESKYGSMFIEDDAVYFYYVEVPGDYKNPNYKATDTLGSSEEDNNESSKGMQCIEFLKEIPYQYKDDISFIREFPELKYLSIANPNHAKYLRYAGKLQVLIIGRDVPRNLSFLDRDFDGTSNPQLASLKYLRMNLYGISDLKYIQNRPGLEYLTLEIGRNERLTSIGPLVGRGGLINKVSYGDEKGVADSKLSQKSIKQTLAWLNWPKLKYLGITGAITSNFVWMTKFDNLEMLKLNITFSSYYRESIKTEDSEETEDSQSPPKKPEPYYQATDLIPFKDKNLKELEIRARGFDSSDCDILKRTLVDVNVYCY